MTESLQQRKTLARDWITRVGMAIALAAPLLVQAQSCATESLPSGPVLDQASNSRGHQLVVRYADSSACPQLRGRRCYRFEYEASGAILASTTYCDFLTPRNLSVRWDTESKGTVTLVEGWFSAVFDREHPGGWQVRRRID